jgi:hypothetical protein
VDQGNKILLDLLVNVAANIVATLILGGLALIVLTNYRSRGVRRFFGVAGGGASVKIYLSAIAVKKGGTTGTAEIREGFHGDAMTELEYRHALRFASLLRSGSFSWVLTTVLGSRAGADKILSTIEKSPSYRQNKRDDESQIVYENPPVSAQLHESTCTVLVGGPIYNLLTHELLRSRPTNANRFFEFIRENDSDGNGVRGIRDLTVRVPESHVRRTSNGSIIDYFIVSRLTLERGKKTFVCAGTCTAATAAAVDQLANWEQFKKFDDKDFGVLYRIYLPHSSASTAEGRESDPDEATAIELLRESSRTPNLK